MGGNGWYRWCCSRPDPSKSSLLLPWWASDCAWQNEHTGELTRVSGERVRGGMEAWMVRDQTPEYLYLYHHYSGHWMHEFRHAFSDRGPGPSPPPALVRLPRLVYRRSILFHTTGSDGLHDAPSLARNAVWPPSQAPKIYRSSWAPAWSLIACREGQQPAN